MINLHEKTNQSGKVRFQEFGSSSLDVMIMYFVNSPRWDDLIDVKESIVDSGEDVDINQLIMKASTEVLVEQKHAESMMKLMDTLDDLDDVQKVHSNIDFSDEFLSAAI